MWLQNHNLLPRDCPTRVQEFTLGDRSVLFGLPGQYSAKPQNMQFPLYCLCLQPFAPEICAVCLRVTVASRCELGWFGRVLLAACVMNHMDCVPILSSIPTTRFQHCCWTGTPLEFSYLAFAFLPDLVPGISCRARFVGGLDNGRLPNLKPLPLN